MIFDSHAHYDDKQFDIDREELLESLPDLGVGTVVNVSASYESWRRCVEMAEKYPYIYAAVGTHPDEVGVLNEETFAEMKEWCTIHHFASHAQSLDLLRTIFNKV